MFDRSRQQVEQGALSVELVLMDGVVCRGRLVVPPGRPIYELLNGQAAFLEFEPFDGERQFVAKGSIRSVKLLGVKGVPQLGQRLRDLDGFDPYQVLGVEKGTAWEEIRISYFNLAKTYHPDRFSTVEMPGEVAQYLEGMSRRINAAYETLEVALAAERMRSGGRSVEAIYVSRAR